METLNCPTKTLPGEQELTREKVTCRLRGLSTSLSENHWPGHSTLSLYGSDGSDTQGKRKLDWHGPIYLGSCASLPNNRWATTN